MQCYMWLQTSTRLVVCQPTINLKEGEKTKPVALTILEGTDLGIGLLWVQTRCSSLGVETFNHMCELNQNVQPQAF